MYQRITLIGNLGKDPESKYTPTGTMVTNMSLATNRTWNDANGQRMKEVTWWRVTVWGKRAESCNQYLRKGAKILVEGRMIVDPATGGPKVWTRQDGSSGASFEIHADGVTFLDTRENNGGEHHEEQEDAPF